MTLPEFITAISEPGDIRELRALHTDPTGSNQIYAARYSNPVRLSVDATIMSDDPGTIAVWMTINPVKKPKYGLDGPIARSKYAAGNNDVVCRAVIAIDIDPVRPSGVGATTAEKFEARKVRDKALTYLRDHLLPEPIQINSGSGYHLWLLCDRTTPITSTQVAAFLRAIAQACDSDAAHVDCAISNDARVMRLPGTYNRKGPHTAERPHRKSSLLHMPETLTRITAAQVTAVAGQVTEKQRPAKDSVIMPIGDMEDRMWEFIQQYPDHLAVEDTSTRNGVTYFELAECPMVGYQHSNSDVGHGKTCLTVSASQGPGFNCFGGNCTGNSKNEKKTFGDLCELLFEETGIANKVSFKSPEQERAEYEAYVAEQFELVRKERPLMYASIDWDDNYDPDQVPLAISAYVPPLPRAHPHEGDPRQERVDAMMARGVELATTYWERHRDVRMDEFVFLTQHETPAHDSFLHVPLPSGEPQSTLNKITPDPDMDARMAAFISSTGADASGTDAALYGFTWDDIEPWLYRMYLLQKSFFELDMKAIGFSTWDCSLERATSRGLRVLGIEKARERYDAIVLAQDVQAACDWLGPRRLAWVDMLLSQGRVELDPPPPAPIEYITVEELKRRCGAY